MWLLIEVNHVADVGKNEARRLLIKGEPIIHSQYASTTNMINCRGSDVHPATKE